MRTCVPVQAQSCYHRNFTFGVSSHLTKNHQSHIQRITTWLARHPPHRVTMAIALRHGKVRRCCEAQPVVSDPRQQHRGICCKLCTANLRQHLSSIWKWSGKPIALANPESLVWFLRSWTPVIDFWAMLLESTDRQLLRRRKLSCCHMMGCQHRFICITSKPNNFSNHPAAREL